MSVHRLRTATAVKEAANLAQRMEQLRLDAARIASDHVGAMMEALEEAAELAEQVAAGGEPYPVGVREIARRTHQELAPVLLTLRSIKERGVN
jgi:hypothetical protein